MTQKTTEKIWHNGRFIDWDQATIHVMSHVVHYASAMFEGIRCYETARGPAIFRLREHITRLLHSCLIYRSTPPYTLEELCQACVDVVRVNKVRACYLRPIVFRGYGTFGVNPLPNPIETYIICWEWGKYLGPEALEQGVDVCVSTWTRISSNTMPPMAKVSANYMNSQLIKMEAIINGYAEGIALDARGNISEGSGENLFMVMNGTVYTPPIAASILPGITRDTVVDICRMLGIEVVKQEIPREMLYIADEVFFTGTAAEITPIRSIDKIIIGKGQRGPITKRLQEEFFAITSGQKEAPGDWLTFVE
ncbi:MAG: branched-chain amino acid transaminase [Acidobacteriota bacterium]|nr:branched-chain amino acid transaminase [Blastocatellia bacterium]MDW8240185.1 branched-chain amino acid transaminase [Acidobacteriota bacterium]